MSEQLRITQIARHGAVGLYRVESAFAVILHRGVESRKLIVTRDPDVALIVAIAEDRRFRAYRTILTRMQANCWTSPSSMTNETSELPIHRSLPVDGD